MRINSKEKMFDQPVLKIREVVRSAMEGKLNGQKKSDIIEIISKILKKPIVESKKVQDKLIQEGFLILNKVKTNNKFHYHLEETLEGRRFGIASASPAISRKKADQLLQTVIDRAQEINTNEELVYYVERIKVFGSYLTGKEELGDLDVAVKLKQKYEGNDLSQRKENRISLAINSGKQFRNVVEEAYWPEIEIKLMLKKNMRGLSLHSENDEVLEHTQSKIVYELLPLKIVAAKN